MKSRRQTPLRPLINGVCRPRALLLAPSQCLCVVNKVVLFKHIRAWRFSFSFEIESPGPGAENGPMMENHPWMSLMFWGLPGDGPFTVAGVPPPMTGRLRASEEEKTGRSVVPVQHPNTSQSRGWLVQWGHALKVAQMHHYLTFFYSVIRG